MLLLLMGTLAGDCQHGANKLLYDLVGTNVVGDGFRAGAQQTWRYTEYETS